MPRDNNSNNPHSRNSIFPLRSSLIFRRNLSLRQQRPTLPSAVSSRYLQPEPHGSTASSKLHGRLEEILIFELLQNGERNYLNLSVRGLYRHVISSITGPVKPKMQPLHAPAEHNVKEEGDNNGDDYEKQVSFSQHVTVEQPETRLERNYSVRNYGVRNYSVRVGEEDNGGGNEVTYRERIGGYLHPRDMRRLVTPFSASNEPELIVRRHVMLLNFDPLRAIILRDRLLVLVPEGADSLLISIEKRVRGGAIDMAYSFAESEGPSPPSAPTSEADVGEETASNLSGIPEEDSSGLNSEASGQHQGGDEGTDDLRDSSHSSRFRVSSSASSIASKIKQRITSKHKESYEPTDSAGSSNDDEGEEDEDMYLEWEEMNAKDWIDLPFELQCTDAVLHVVCSILSDDTTQLEETASACLNGVLSGQYGLSDDPLSGLRHVKDAIHEMETRVKGFVQSMNRILDDDEDMALMNLSRLITHPQRFIKPVTQQELEEEADEPELILEAHMQIGLTLSNSLDLMQGQIDTASELVDQKLDSVRNRILYSNMIISVLSLCVATASFVGSMWGMNVSVPGEEGENSFMIIMTSTVLGSFALMCVILVGLFFSGAIPSPGMKEKDMA